MNNSLDSTQRIKNLDKASKEDFDLIVIGGGITGSGIAFDAATRGMKVLLLEKQDFAAGTSSRSTKLIHGGLRYLKEMEFNLVRQVGKERAILYKNASYLVHPEKLLLPIYKSGSLGYYSTSLALWVYDLLAGVQKKESRIMLSAKKTSSTEPLLSTKGLLGAGMYYEYRTDDARLTLEVLKTAVSYSAQAYNYTQVTDFIATEGQITGVETTDLLNNTTYRFTAKHVVNATGPWVDELRKKNSEDLNKHLFLTKGVHLVFSHLRVPLKHSMYFDTPDRRMVFAIKREGKVYLGTTDTEYHASNENPICTKEDKEYLLNAVNKMFTSLNLQPTDIESSWAGLRPLIHEQGKSPSEVSRKDEIFIAQNGLISIAGGKLTAFRKMAQKIIDKIQATEKRFGSCKTSHIPLIGSLGFASKGYEMLTDKLPVYTLKFQEQKNLIRLVHSYGNASFEMMDKATDDLSLIYAEIAYCINNESLEHLADYYSRRSGKMLFSSNELLENQSEILAHFVMLKGLSETQIAKEKELIEQLKTEALGSL
jgi:glycerol-3-phosphate dehydrogenase